MGAMTVDRNSFAVVFKLHEGKCIRKGSYRGENELVMLLSAVS
jgi:hypothetical protein